MDFTNCVKIYTKLHLSFLKIDKIFIMKSTYIWILFTIIKYIYIYIYKIDDRGYV